MANGRMRVSGLFRSGSVNEESRVSALAQKSVRTIDLRNASQTVSEIGYIPLSDEAYHISKVHFYAGRVGTVFKGKPEPNLTISELLRRQKAF